jgi:hypothetical protein
VVFGLVSPPARLLTPLERYLSQVAAKRVYAAIAQTWSSGDAGGGRRALDPSTEQGSLDGGGRTSKPMACGAAVSGGRHP